MKTKNQIIRHTANCKFSDVDWQRVLDYCKKHYGSGVHRAQKPISNSTYEQFIEWIDNGYASGDIVNVGKVVGIIGDDTPEQTYLAAYLKDDRIIQEKLDVSHDSIRKAPKRERQRFLMAMDAESLSFNERLAKVVAKKEIPIFERIGFECKGKTYYGIADKLEDGMISFVFVVENRKLFKSVKFSSCDLSCFPIKKKGIDEIDSALAENGLRWNFNKRVLEERPKRVKVGETYWYINDRLKIVSGREDGKKTAAERLEAGNYFVNFSQAISAAIKIKDYLKDGGGL